MSTLVAKVRNQESSLKKKKNPCFLSYEFRSSSRSGPEISCADSPKCTSEGGTFCHGSHLTDLHIFVSIWSLYFAISKALLNIYLVIWVESNWNCWSSSSSSNTLNKQTTFPKTKMFLFPLSCLNGISTILRLEKEAAAFFGQGLWVALKEGEKISSVCAWTFKMIGGSDIYEQIALIWISRTLKFFEEATWFHFNSALRQS